MDTVAVRGDSETTSYKLMAVRASEITEAPGSVGACVFLRAAGSGRAQVYDYG